MKVDIDFERPPLRAVYRISIETELSDPFSAAAEAGATLQLQESRRIRILSISVGCVAHEQEQKEHQ